MKNEIRHVFSLGVKEIIGLFRDPLMVVLILFSFTVSVYTGALASPDAIDHAAIAVVDEDNSQLSKRVTDAFIPPLFLPPEKISRPDMLPALDSGKYTFVVVFPANFQEKVLANHEPSVQLNVDATRMTQAFSGTGYVENIILKEVNAFVQENTGDPGTVYSADFIVRSRFNPNLTRCWDGAINQLVNNIAMIALILTGAALIRERESGTLEHLMVMPVTSFEVMVSKIWSMSLVVFVVTLLSLFTVVHGALLVPIEGSLGLYMVGVIINLFAMTSLGIFLACFSKDMPQLGILMILVLLPMQILSGGKTPQTNMPETLQWIMQISPTTHIVDFSRAILLRGAGFSLVWKIMLKMFIIGSIYFAIAVSRFRKTVSA